MPKFRTIYTPHKPTFSSAQLTSVHAAIPSTFEATLITAIFPSNITYWTTLKETHSTTNHATLEKTIRSAHEQPDESDWTAEQSA